MNASTSDEAFDKDFDKPSSWENKNSLAIRLLRIVFSIYLLITVSITALQMVSEYRSEKETIEENFLGYQDIFYEGVANALWNYDIDQLNAMLDGMDELHDISGVKIFDSQGRLLLRNGQVADDVSSEMASWSGLFSHSFDINYLNENIGLVVLYSSESIVFNKVKDSLMVILINATIKTIILWFLFIWAFKRYLVSALDEFISRMEDMDFDRVTPSYIKLDTFQSYELGRFEAVFNDMNERIYHSKESLETLNNDLESLVEERTRKVRVQQEMLEEMSKQGRMGAWEIDLVDHEIHWSEMVREIHQVDESYQPDLVSVMSFIKRPEDRDIISRHLYECIDQTKPWQLEVPIHTSQGQELWVSMTGRGIFEGDQCLRMIGSYQDIDAIIKTKQQLEKAKVEAESAARMKSEFLATMSHEIRTPLNGVLGMLHLLMQSKLNEQQEYYAELAERSGNALLGLINDILDFSKADARHIELEQLLFDVTELLDDVVLSFGQKAQEKKLELILDTSMLSESNSQVVGDSGRLRQVLVNLIGNAIKFTSQGEVLVTARLVEKSSKSIELVIDVKDSGIGIEPTKLSNIFELFTQVDASTTRQYGGTGLGLAISRQLCQLMGGDITAESTPGIGSTFKCSIELAKTSSAPRIGSLFNDLSESVRHQNILLVDESDILKKVLTHYLEPYGVKIFSVTTLKDARARLADKSLAIDALMIDSKVIEIEYSGLADINSVASESGVAMIVLKPLGYQGEVLETFSIVPCAELEKPITRKALMSMFAELDRLPAKNLSSGIQNKLLKDKVVPPVELPEPTANLSEAAQASTSSDQGALNAQWDCEYRILLVEDNCINQMVAQGILDSLGLKSDIADNGKKAVDRLLQEKAAGYDLILMDCQMPEMDGYEATRLIRQGEAGADNRDITIVAMTANAMDGDREKCLEAGMNDYMVKPVDANVLLEKLQHWLSKD